MGFCAGCPLRDDKAAEEACLDHPERKARLVLYAASQVPVQCHMAIDDVNVNEAIALMQDGKDWRMDLKVTHPCYGTVMNAPRST